MFQSKVLVEIIVGRITVNIQFITKVEKSKFMILCILSKIMFQHVLIFA